MFLEAAVHLKRRYVFTAVPDVTLRNAVGLRFRVAPFGTSNFANIYNSRATYPSLVHFSTHWFFAQKLRYRLCIKHGNGKGKGKGKNVKVKVTSFLQRAMNAQRGQR